MKMFLIIKIFFISNVIKLKIFISSYDLMYKKSHDQNDQLIIIILGS